MAIAKYRFGEWVPDQGDYFGEDGGVINLLKVESILPEFGGLRQINKAEVLPATSSTGFGTVTGATTNRTAKLFSFTSRSAGAKTNQFLYAYDRAKGDTSNIRKFDGSSFSSVGRAGGYTLNTYGWDFTQYGETILATNGVDAIQRSSFTGSFSKNNDTSGTPTAADPRAKTICAFKGHVFIGDIDLTAGSSGTVPETYGGAFGSLLAQEYSNVIWWSGLNNERRFGTPDVTSAILGSDFRFLYDKYGAVTKLHASDEYMAVARDYAMQVLTGPPFDVITIEDGVGCDYRNSFVTVGQNIYFWTTKGPARIVGGREVEYIGKGKIARYFEELTGSSVIRKAYISAAKTLDSKYVVWSCFQPFRPDTKTGFYVNSILVYSIEADSFGFITEPGINTIVSMASYKTQYEGTYVSGGPADKHLEGVVFVGNTLLPFATSGATSLDEYICIPGGEDSKYTELPLDSETSDTCTIRTAFFEFDKEGKRSFRIQRIRPIYWTHGDYQSVEPDPSPTQIVSVKLFPRSKYADVFGRVDDTTAASYSEFTAASNLNDNGWILTDGAPFAERYAVEFVFKNNRSLRLIYGFEVEVDFGMKVSTGKTGV